MEKTPNYEKSLAHTGSPHIAYLVQSLWRTADGL